MLDGSLQINDDGNYQIALFSLPRDKKIRCQCLRMTRPCNLPIYSKIVFITNGQDYCVHGFTCATEGVLKRHKIKRGKSLTSIPELNPIEIEEISRLIANNVKDVVGYLIALRDRNEDAIRAEERRLGAKRLPLNEAELDAIRFKNTERLIQADRNRLEKEMAHQKRRHHEKRFACAHSLSLTAANWLNIRTCITDIIAYSDGRGKLPAKVVEKINGDEYYAILRPSHG